MAKYYGVGGSRIGSVGNETYNIFKGDNLVKAKIIHTKNTRTKKQVMQRCFMGASVKASKEIGSDFLNSCFEYKSKRLSDVNKFNSINVKRACIVPKDAYKNEDVMSFGNFQVSQGSMYESLVVETIVNGTTNCNGLKLVLTDYATDLSTVTVGKVSTDLLSQYPSLKEGMKINAFGLYNPDVTYDATNFIVVGDSANLISAKQNFILDKSSTETIKSKGFMVVKPTASTTFGLILLNEDLSTGFMGGVQAGDNPGYVCFFAANKVMSKVNVSNSFIVGNTAYNNIVTALNNDLSGAQKALHTYEIASDPVIVNDDLI